MSLRKIALFAFFLSAEALFVFIGSYQLFWRAPYKAALIAEQEQSSKLITGTLDLALSGAQPFESGLFTLKAQFAPDYSLRVGARSIMGVDGNGLVGLIDLSQHGLDGWLFVDRGWARKDWQQDAADSMREQDLLLRLVPMPSAQQAAEKGRYNQPERGIWNRIVPQQIFAYWGIDPSQKPAGLLPFYAQVVSDQQLSFGSPLGAMPLPHAITAEIPNNHFGYAMTWYSLALILLAMMLLLLRTQKKAAR